MVSWPRPPKEEGPESCSEVAWRGGKADTLVLHPFLLHGGCETLGVWRLREPHIAQW